MVRLLERKRWIEEIYIERGHKNGHGWEQVWREVGERFEMSFLDLSFQIGYRLNSTLNSTSFEIAQPG